MKQNFVLTLALAGLGLAIGPVGCSSSGSTACTSNCTPPPPPTVTLTGTKTQQVGVSKYQYVSSASSGAVTLSSTNDSATTINSSGVSTPNNTTIGTATLTATSTTDTAKTASVDVHVVNQIIYHVGGRSLSLVNVGDRSTAPLQTGSGFDPEFFADHQRAVFTLNVMAGNQLEVFAIDGALNGIDYPTLILTFDLNRVDLATPSFDGTMLAFPAFDPTSGLQGYYVATITGLTGSTSPTPRLVYQNPTKTGIALGQPRWTHDNKSLAINEVTADGHSDAWIVPISGGPAGTGVEVTHTQADGTGLGFGGPLSLNDKTLYSNICDVGLGNCQIFATTADGKTNGLGSLIAQGFAPVLSPNGLYLAIESAQGISVVDLKKNNVDNILPIITGAGHASW